MFSANTSQVSNDVKYIEDFCSVYLRTGTGSSQTVTTGLKENTGALVISKSRSAATDWAWYDSFRGATYDLVSNSTAAQTTQAQGLTSFNTDGHTWGTLAKVNTSGATYVDMVLKPTPKFFDVVTYTGNGSQPRAIPHNLTTTPGCVIVKNTSSGGGWYVYHRSSNASGFTAAESYMLLNSTNAVTDNAFIWGNTAPTSTDFTVSTQLNQSANTYVAYIFAHDAGGFGLTGTDNVISCGSFTTDGSGNATVNLGYEPQWLLWKPASDAGNWQMVDNMRGWVSGGSGTARLFPNTSGAEVTTSVISGVNATGFNIYNGSASSTQIYIAIRRGPMKVPTDGTKVFKPLGTSPASTTSGVGFPADMSLAKYAVSSQDWLNSSRLTNKILYTNSTGAEDSIFGPAGPQPFDTQDGFKLTGISTTDYAFWAFKRAPGFFDEVCYTGTGSAQNVTHNLTVAPELMIVKCRNDAGRNWQVYSSALGNGYRLALNQTLQALTTSIWDSTTPTSTQFRVSSDPTVGASTFTYVAYLFASCPGVSKVGSVTHVEPTTVSCGFTPRFVLIKSTTSTGTDDWFVFDSARGITAGNDPYLRLNSTGAENTPFGAADLIDPTADGFIMNGFGGGNYIFLAIA